MRRIIPLVAVAALVALPVVAQTTPSFQGLWSSEGRGQELSLELTHVRGSQYNASINVVVPISEEYRGCGGGISGVVELGRQGGVLRVANESYDPASAIPGDRHQFCEVRLTPKPGREMELEEQNGCLDFHGASCEFSGVVVHDDAGV